MSKLATYFKESVSVLKKGFAYARVVPVLLLALLKRLTGDGFYEVSFTKIGRKWYCNVHEAVQDAIHTDRRCILQRPQRVLHRGDMTLPRHPLPPGPLSRAHPHLQNQQEPSALPHIFRVKKRKETQQGPHRAMCDTAPDVVCISGEILSLTPRGALPHGGCVACPPGSWLPPLHLPVRGLREYGRNTRTR